MPVPDVYAEVIGQPDVVSVLRQAVAASHGDPDAPTAAMTHAWLFTGPRRFRSFGGRARLRGGAAVRRPRLRTLRALPDRAARHARRRSGRSYPEGLSIAVKEMRAVVQVAARTPTTGRWQIVVIEDADRLTEQAADALLKAVEEPSPHTVFLLCAPSTHPDDVLDHHPVPVPGGRARQPPDRTSIAEVLPVRDGVDEATAQLGRRSLRGARRPGPPAGHRPGSEGRARDDVLDIPGRLDGVGAVLRCRRPGCWTAPRARRRRSPRGWTPPSSTS